MYPEACLLDPEGDGRFERIIFRPYEPEKARPRELRIAPVLLKPLPADELRPHAMVFHRSVSISAMDATSVTLQLEHRQEHHARPTATILGKPRTLVLPLKPGAAGEIGGLRLRLEQDGVDWRIITEGGFPGWLKLSEDRGSVTLLTDDTPTSR